MEFEHRLDVKSVVFGEAFDDGAALERANCDEGSAICQATRATSRKNVAPRSARFTHSLGSS